MFQKVAEGVYVRPALLYATETVLLADADGVTVVDPNYFEHEVLAARDALETLHAEVGGERWLLLTHSDYDHIVGVPAFPDVRVVTHASWDEENERRARAFIERFDEEYYIPRRHRFQGPIRRHHAVQADGERFRTFTCFHADGHTRDGLVAFHEPSGVLLTGDYLSALEIPFVYVSALRYRRTLAKLADILRDLSPRVLIAEHGPVTDDAAEMRRRLDDATRYLDAVLAAAWERREDDEAAAVDAIAAATLGAWPGGIRATQQPRHRENARIAWREQRGEAP